MPFMHDRVVISNVGTQRQALMMYICPVLALITEVVNK